MRKAKNGEFDYINFTIYSAVAIPDTSILEEESRRSDRQLAWTSATLVNRTLRKLVPEIVELFPSEEEEEKIELGELISVIGAYREEDDGERYMALLHTVGEVMTTPTRHNAPHNIGLDTDVFLHLFKRSYEKAKGQGA